MAAFACFAALAMININGQIFTGIVLKATVIVDAPVNKYFVFVHKYALGLAILYLFFIRWLNLISEFKYYLN